MEVTRPQRISLDGVNEFLLAHEDCGGGFDVSHPSGVGSGRVAIACRGCGATHEYATASVEVEREITIERLPPGPRERARPRRSVVVEPPRRIEGAGTERSASRPRRRRRDPRGNWITAALVAFSVLALAFVVVRVAGEGAGEAEPAPMGQGAATAAPAPVPEAPRATEFATPRYALSLPPTWSRRPADAGLLFAPPGGGASLAVYFERDASLTRGEMEAAAARVLARRNPGAAISRPRGLRLGGARGFAVSASTTDARVTATGLLAGDRRYLLIRRVRRGAGAELRGQAIEAEASFRAR